MPAYSVAWISCVLKCNFASVTRCSPGEVFEVHERLQVPQTGFQKIQWQRHYSPEVMLHEFTFSQRVYDLFLRIIFGIMTFRKRKCL